MLRCVHPDQDSCRAYAETLNLSRGDLDQLCLGRQGAPNSRRLGARTDDRPVKIDVPPMALVRPGSRPDRLIFRFATKPGRIRESKAREGRFYVGDS